MSCSVFFYMEEGFWEGFLERGSKKGLSRRHLEWKNSFLWKLASVLDSWALKPSCNFLRFPAMCPPKTAFFCRKVHFSAGKCISLPETAFFCRKIHVSVGKPIFLQENFSFSAVYSGGLGIMNGSLFQDDSWKKSQDLGSQRPENVAISKTQKHCDLKSHPRSAVLLVKVWGLRFVFAASQAKYWNLRFQNAAICDLTPRFFCDFSVEPAERLAILNVRFEDVALCCLVLRKKCQSRRRNSSRWFCSFCSIFCCFCSCECD